MMGAMFQMNHPSAASAAPAPLRGSQHHPGRVLTVLVTLITTGLWLLLTSGNPAAAHSELATSTPADGASLSSPPANVSFTFNESIMDAGLQVVASGANGPLPLDAPMVAGPTVTVAWPSDAPDGTYQVAYRVVSADGHPIDGSIRFSYTGGAANTDALGQGQSAAPTDAPPATATSADSNAPFVWWAGVLVVLAGVSIGAGFAYYLRHRARSNPPDDPTP